MELNRFAFSTHAFVRHSLKKALKRIARAGFKGVEIFADKPHLWLDNVSPREVARLERQLDKLNLFVSNVNTGTTAGFWSDAPQELLFEPSVISRSRTYREWRIAYTKKALRFGKAVGAQNVSIASGRTLPGVPPEKAQKLLEEGLKRLVEEADHLNQRFSLTCEPGLFVERPDELKALLKKLHSAHFGANLDVGHVEVLGDDVAKTIRELKGSIFHVHLEDIRGRKDYHRIPGDGDIDFRAITNALDAGGYTGPLTWDIFTYDENPDEALERSMKYSRTLVLELSLRKRPGKSAQTSTKKTLKHAKQ